MLETEFGPYIYLYEETLATPDWFPWVCGLTGIYYGGACWLYSTFPNSDEQESFIQRARKSLSLLTGEYKPYDSESVVINNGITNTDLPGRLRVFDAFDNTIIRGRIRDFKTSKSQVFFGSKDKIDDSGQTGYEDGAVVKLANRQPYQQDYSYSAAQIGVLSGIAEVKSKVKENGINYTLASGLVKTNIYHFRSRTLPKDGFYWSYGPQYSYQSLNIGDFSDQLPLTESSTEEDIPVVISDPNTQNVIENYTNSYAVRLQSIGVLVGGGFSFHYKRKNDPNFWAHDGGVWLNAINYFQSKVGFQNREVKKDYFAFLSGASLEWNSYYNWTKSKIALGFHVQYSVFPSVDMPDDMEFRGNPRYNSEKGVFERPRMFVDELEFSSTSFGISLSYIFEEFDY